MPFYRVAPLLRIRKEPEGYTIYLRYHGAYWMNETSKQILDMVCDHHGIDEVIQNLIADYDISESQARLDVDGLVRRLLLIGALIPEPPSDGEHRQLARPSPGD